MQSFIKLFPSKPLNIIKYVLRQMRLCYNILCEILKLGSYLTVCLTHTLCNIHPALIDAFILPLISSNSHTPLYLLSIVKIEVSVSK